MTLHTWCDEKCDFVKNHPSYIPSRDLRRKHCAPACFTYFPEPRNERAKVRQMLWGKRTQTGLLRGPAYHASITVTVSMPVSAIPAQLPFHGPPLAPVTGDRRFCTAADLHSTTITQIYATPRANRPVIDVATSTKKDWQRRSFSPLPLKESLSCGCEFCKT